MYTRCRQMTHRLMYIYTLLYTVYIVRANRRLTDCSTCSAFRCRSFTFRQPAPLSLARYAHGDHSVVCMEVLHGSVQENILSWGKCLFCLDSCSISVSSKHIAG